LETVPQDDILIDLVRVARNPDRDDAFAKWNSGADQPSLYQIASALAAKMISGTLSRDDEFQSDIERAIERGNRADYDGALEMFHIFRTIAGMIAAGKGLESAIYHGLASREFCAFGLATMLTLVANESICESDARKQS
ncbi:MAG: hypothetical protein WBV39_07070, partial [Rudaea sp.]